uniref:Salivary C-type lectin n=1 Tax=Sergentomyia schwetzi TaxID=114605 RepID=A0A6B9VJZ2_9DIPT|nr:salivary C-type lectin [Sergentomyia schwetzi]
MFRLWLIFFILAYSHYANCNNPPPGETFVRKVEGKTFFIFHRRVNWMTAQIECEKHGLTLASVESRKQAEKLYAELRKIEPADAVIWIGGYNYQNDGLWRWVSNGQLIGYQNWSPGEPNQKTKMENCSTIEMWREGVWNDDECLKEFYYICEFS